MTNSLATTNGSALTRHFNTEQWQVIKSQIAKGCTDAELQLFAEVCTQSGLNPFMKEIYAISRGGKMTIQVSIDGLRKKAAETGLYDGSATFWCGEDGQWREVWLSSAPPSAAKTIVYRRGSSQPFVSVARFSSYKQENNPIWKKMPDLMIGKCSESLALRKAFPEQTAGLLTSEEMDQANSDSMYQVKAELEQPQEPTGWDETLWGIFEKGVSKCATLEDLEKLIGWLSKTTEKHQPSPRQDREITQIMKGLADELNGRSTVNIPKRVKSAQIDDVPLREEIETHHADNDIAF